MGQAEKRPNTSTFSLFKYSYSSSVTRPRTVTQNKKLRFSKRVKWIKSASLVMLEQWIDDSEKNRSE